MGRKKATPMGTWCILRSNQTLRELIKRRMDEQNLSIQALATKMELTYESIRRYLTGEEEKSLSHFYIVQICKELGIQVSLNIEVTS